MIQFFQMDDIIARRPIHNNVQTPLDTSTEQLTREGFSSLGNTCYMNSILQSVFGIPTFAKDLLTQGIRWEKVSCDDLNKPLSQLLILKDIRDVEIKGQLPINVKKSISTVADILGDEQNDAHGSLSQCLDQMKLNVETLKAMFSTDREDKVEKPSPLTRAGNATTKGLFVLLVPILKQSWIALLFVKPVVRLLSTLKLLMKSQQPVEISKYLDVSSLCNENTKPPYPLTNQAPHEAYDIPNVSEEMMPDILSQSIPAKRVTSDFIDFTVLQVGSNEHAEVQN
ncbi:Ubiquitin carboxyl-terminal hydrolase 29 [Lemmus lemmus]